jgi:hypothetical protein
MFRQKNFWIVGALMLVSGFASTHFVKYPQRQLRTYSFLELLVVVRLDPFPTCARAMTVELDELA